VSVSRLYDLQQTDLALAHALARREGLDNGERLRDETVALADRLAALHGQHAAAHSRMRALELEVHSLRDKRAKIEQEMYSGRIGSPKELAAMQEEVEVLGRQQSRLEDQILGLMEETERLDVHLRETGQQLEAARAALDRHLEAYHQAVADTDARIAEMTARRADLASTVDEALLRRYDLLRERKGGLAVVAVRAGVCDGCHVVVPERLYTRLERDPDLVAACDGCGRLLVFRPPDPG
jgi:predicted  nucleic acid-binding Zn-ribbon protein